MAEFIVAIQNDNQQAYGSNLDGGLVLVVVMTTVVLALVVIMFIGASARRASKR